MIPRPVERPNLALLLIVQGGSIPFVDGRTSERGRNDLRLGRRASARCLVEEPEQFLRERPDAL